MRITDRVQNDRTIVYAVTALTAFIHTAGVISAGIIGVPEIWIQSLGDLLTDYIVIYSVVGGVLLGALPGYLLARKALVTPLLSSVFIFHTMLGKWLYWAPALRSNGALISDSFYAYQRLWPVIAVFLIGIGVVEYVVRNRVYGIVETQSGTV